MFGNLLPFLMFGILLAAVLSRPLARLRWLSLPVALVILGGLTTSTFLSLMILPTLYSLIDDVGRFFGKVARAA